MNKKNKHVLRSSRIIKIKAIGLNTNYGSLTTSLSNSQQEEVKPLLQKLLKLLKLQDSDQQILSNILQQTATSIEGLKGLLDENAQVLQVLKYPKSSQQIREVLLNILSSDLTKIKNKLLNPFLETNATSGVLKKLNDGLSYSSTTPISETIEIKRTLLLIVYYFSKQI